MKKALAVLALILAVVLFPALIAGVFWTVLGLFWETYFVVFSCITGAISIVLFALFIQWLIDYFYD